MPNCGQNPIDHGALDHDDDDADKYVENISMNIIFVFNASDDVHHVLLTVAVRDLVTSVKSYLW